MAETTVTDGSKKRGRPRKAADATAAVVGETAAVAADTVETKSKSFLKKAKDAVVDAVSLNDTTKNELLTLGKGVLISATDAALVHVTDNLSTVDFGKWNSLVQTLASVALRELRNYLHGGVVSSDAFVEAVKCVVNGEDATCPEPEKPEAETAAETEPEPEAEAEKKDE